MKKGLVTNSFKLFIKIYGRISAFCLLGNVVLQLYQNLDDRFLK